MGELYLFYVTEHRLLIIKLLFIHLGLPQTAALFSGFNVDVLQLCMNIVHPTLT